MMESFGIQYRPSNLASNRPRYPLTFDQRLTQGDRYREAAEQLNANLQSIEQFYASSSAGLHTGSPDCERCAKKKHSKALAYYNYFLDNKPGRWDEALVEYRQELEEMFNRSEPPLEAIHQRFKAELREHLRKDLCTMSTGDSKETLEYKAGLNALLKDAPIEEALTRGIQKKIETLASLPGLNGPIGLDPVRDASHPAGFGAALQEARTAEKRAELYSAYYCTPLWNDNPQQRNMKSKYGKLFESGLSHDMVLGMWKKEAQDQKTRDVGRLKQRLGELQMAQSAHLKNKKRKMEKDARIKDKEYVIVPRLVECSLRGCGVQMDASKEGPIECAICDWLVGRSEERRHFYYCSEDHVEDDFDEHEKHEHACIMRDQCYYSPMTGPPGETGACGICPDCVDSQVISFFCSQECYTHNLDAHRDEVHYHRGIEGTAYQLDNFRPEPGLEIVTQ